MEKIHHICNTYILNKNLYDMNKNKVERKQAMKHENFILIIMILFLHEVYPHLTETLTIKSK